MILGIAIAFCVCGAIIVGISLKVIFKSLPPTSIGGYKKCKGGWWEAELNQCAAGLLMVPQQPINTYSNLAYVAGGAFLIFYLNTLPAYIFSLALLYLSVGSSLYHATSTRWAGSLDVSGIYAVFSALTVYAASTHTKFNDSVVAIAMFVVAFVAGFLLRYKFRGSMAIKVGIFLVITYAILIVNILRANLPLANGYLISSLALFVVAFLVWTLDKKRLFPLNRWGHGLWHIFTGAAITILFYGIHVI